MQKKLFLVLAVILCQSFASYASSSDEEPYEDRPPNQHHRKPGPLHITPEQYAISQLNLKAEQLKISKAEEARKAAEFMAEQQFHRDQLAAQKRHDDLLAQQIALEKRKITEAAKARQAEQAQHQHEEEQTRRRATAKSVAAEKTRQAVAFLELFLDTNPKQLDLFMKRALQEYHQKRISQDTIDELRERQRTIRQAEDIAEQNLARKGFYDRKVAEILTEALQHPDVGISYGMALQIIEDDEKDQAEAQKAQEARQRAAVKAQQEAEQERRAAEHAKQVKLRQAKIEYLRSVGYTPADVGFYKDDDLDKKTLAQIKQMFA